MMDVLMNCLLNRNRYRLDIYVEIVSDVKSMEYMCISVTTCWAWPPPMCIGVADSEWSDV